MPKPVTIPEAENFDPAEPLSEDQHKAIEDFKDEDWNADAADNEDKPKDKEDVTPKDKEDAEDKSKDKEEESEEEDTEDDDNLSEEQKRAKELEAEEAKKAEEEEQKETERLAKKAKELDKTVEEVEKLESDEKAELDRIEAIAKEEGITVEEVKENEAKDVSIAERHSNDPTKLARALRKEQSEYGKVKDELEGLREFKTKSDEARAKFNEDSFNQQMADNKDAIIERYRKEVPAEAEDTDDALFERAKAMIRKVVDKREADKAKEVKETAESTRKELLKALPEEYKEHKSEVKAMLDECSDKQVLSKDFDVAYLANYVRGKKFTPEHIKELEAAAYKRGSEKAKILPKVPGAKTGGKKKTSSIVGTATQADRDRALEMYSKRSDWSDDRKVEEYMKEDKKDDSDW